MHFFIISGMELVVDEQDGQAIFSAILQSWQQRPSCPLKAHPPASHTTAHCACHSLQPGTQKILVRKWRQLGKGSSRAGKSSSLAGSAVPKPTCGVTGFWDPHMRTGETFGIKTVVIPENARRLFGILSSGVSAKSAVPFTGTCPLQKQ